MAVSGLQGSMDCRLMCNPICPLATIPIFWNSWQARGRRHTTCCCIDERRNHVCRWRTQCIMMVDDAVINLHMHGFLQYPSLHNQQPKQLLVFQTACTTLLIILALEGGHADIWLCNLHLESYTLQWSGALYRRTEAAGATNEESGSMPLKEDQHVLISTYVSGGRDARNRRKSMRQEEDTTWDQQAKSAPHGATEFFGMVQQGCN